MVGVVPACLIGALAVRNWDLVDHHRSSVIKHGKFKGRGGRSPAKRMIASRLFRYSAKVRNPTKINDLEGESFAASTGPASSGSDFALDADTFEAWEFGKTIRSDDPMAIPFVGNTQKQRDKFHRLLASGEVSVVNTAKVRGLLVHSVNADGSTRAKQRSVPIGFLRSQRRQPPILGFYDQFARILPAHQKKYDQALCQALTVAGRRRLRASNAGRAAKDAELRRYLNAHPGKFVEARKAAKEAEKLARSSMLSKRGRG